jgi:hypothetical protein
MLWLQLARTRCHSTLLQMCNEVLHAVHMGSTDTHITWTHGHRYVQCTPVAALCIHNQRTSTVTCHPKRPCTDAMAACFAELSCRVYTGITAVGIGHNRHVCMMQTRRA